LVERLVNPPQDPPCEAVFRLASPLPDIGLPLEDVLGLNFDALEVDWDAFNREWPSGIGYQDGGEESDKENEWTVVPVDD